MHKILILVLLFISTLLSENIVELSLDHTKQTHRDFLFNELMNESNSTINNYNNISNTIDTGYLNIHTNFDDNFGFNYSKSVKSFSYTQNAEVTIPDSGINYSAYEFYIGTNTTKYISIKNANKDIEYSTNNLNSQIKDLTFLGVFNYSKISMTSSKIEKLDATKISALDDDARLNLPLNSTTRIYRNYDLEKFTVSTENLYDIAKDDADKKESYILPAIFTKTFNDNLSIFGVLILGYTQENYTSIQNYFKDSNGTSHNIMYSTKITDNIINLNQESKAIKDKQNYVALYHGYQYGFKVTLQYKIKNISIYTTAYQKTTVLTNKYKKATDQVNIVSSANNVAIYENLDYKERYLNFGIKYRF